MVRCPYFTDDRTLADFIQRSVGKFRKRKNAITSEQALKDRAAMLKKKYVPEAPDFNIEYSALLRTAWGKCYFREKRIIINPRMTDYPLWVTDMVIIHEIAHLVHPDHKKGFREIVSRYRLKERAAGFLIAAGMKSGDEISEKSFYNRE